MSVIHFEGVSKRFGQTWVLANVDLRVEKGQSWLITGANGAGKTTLLRIGATLLKPTVGQVHVGSGNEQNIAIERRQIGFLSHRHGLYEALSAVENFRTFGRLAGIKTCRDAPETALGEVGLEGAANQAVHSFSAGMKKRLAIAILKLRAPRLLLLDEPFGQLDAQGIELVQQWIAGHVQQGGTLMISTHLQHLAEPFCDHHLELQAALS